MTKKTLITIVETIVYKRLSYTREPLEDSALDEELDEYFENCFKIDVDCEGIVDDLIEYNIIKELDPEVIINGFGF